MKYTKRCQECHNETCTCNYCEHCENDINEFGECGCDHCPGCGEQSPSCECH